MKKYTKLNDKDKCAFPEREICNYDDDADIERCKYMKYDNNCRIFDNNRWKCLFNN
jgi:hypothetical protein